MCTRNLLELPSTIGELKNLKLLNLSISGIKRLPESIGCLVKLEELNLALCEDLKELPCIRELKDLKMLSLHGSGIGEIKESELPQQIVEAMISRRNNSSQEFSVFISLSCRSSRWSTSNHLAASRLREGLMMRNDQVRGVGSVLALDDKEWSLKEAFSRKDYINNSCNTFIVIFSEEYLKSENSLVELEMISESITNQDKQHVIKVNENIDVDTVNNILRRDPRWRNASDRVKRRAGNYLDSRAASSAEELEEVILEEVMCRLEKMLGIPFTTLLI